MRIKGLGFGNPELILIWGTGPSIIIPNLLECNIPQQLNNSNDWEPIIFRADQNVPTLSGQLSRQVLLQISAGMQAGINCDFSAILTGVDPHKYDLQGGYIRMIDYSDPALSTITVTIDFEKCIII